MEFGHQCLVISEASLRLHTTQPPSQPFSLCTHLGSHLRAFTPISLPPSTTLACVYTHSHDFLPTQPVSHTTEAALAAQPLAMLSCGKLGMPAMSAACAVTPDTTLCNPWPVSRSFSCLPPHPPCPPQPQLLPTAPTLSATASAAPYRTHLVRHSFSCPPPHPPCPPQLQLLPTAPTLSATLTAPDAMDSSLDSRA